MSDEYNSQVSKHYAAYRPPIHERILRQAIETVAIPFTKGLDIGCGTGTSTSALAKFCQTVIGLDPSADMLAKANPSDAVSFVQGTGDNLPLADDSVDIITFAGSLYYAKSNKLVEEILRVGSHDVVVVAYDFEVLLNDALSHLGIEPPTSSSNYDHAENFSGFPNLAEIAVYKGRLSVPATSEQLAHVLFSSSKRYSLLVDRFGHTDTFVEVIKALGHDTNYDIYVDIYFSTYRPKKDTLET